MKDWDKDEKVYQNHAVYLVIKYQKLLLEKEFHQRKIKGDLVIWLLANTGQLTVIIILNLHQNHPVEQEPSK